MHDTYSMTQYWTMLQKDMLALQKTDPQFYVMYIPLSTTLDMASEGKKFEKNETGVMSLQGIMDQIVNYSQQIGPPVTFSLKIKNQEKTHQYHLPEIKDTNTLLFAILYYKHLRRFQEHTYKGPFGNSWPLYIKSNIDRMTDSKRPWSSAQADYLKTQIDNYVSANKLNITEDDILAPATLSPDQYIKTLKIKLTPKPDSVVKEASSELTSKLERLQQTSLDKKILLEEAQQTFETFQRLKADYENAHKDYNEAKRAFTQKPRVSQWFNSNKKSAIASLEEIMNKTAEAMDLNVDETAFQKSQRLLSKVNAAKAAHQVANLAVEMEKSHLEDQARLRQDTQMMPRDQLTESAALNSNTKTVKPPLPNINPANLSASFFHPMPNKQCVIASIIAAVSAAATTTLLYYSM